MNLPTLDQTREKEMTPYGESVRLSNELRLIPDGTKLILNEANVLVKVFTGGRLWGFDIETASYGKLLSYFTDSRIKKRSESLIAFVNRILSIRFPNEYAQDKNKIEKIIGYSEYSLIQSEAKNEMEWFGEVSYQNKVRLDGSLTNPNVRIEKLNSGRFISKIK